MLAAAAANCRLVGRLLCLFSGLLIPPFNFKSQWHIYFYLLSGILLSPASMLYTLNAVIVTQFSGGISTEM